jgi:hypothetical protein
VAVRIYHNPIVRVPVPSDWLFHAEHFAREYVNKKGGDSEANRKIGRWAETWYLCTFAFTWYYGAEFQPLADRALRTGWTPSEVLTVGKNVFHLTTSTIHEKWNFGSTVSGTVSKKMFDHSKATIVVVSVLNVPDVDIVGWFDRNEMTTLLEGTRYVLNENVSRPMTECPGLKDRDRNKWYA